MPIPNITSTLKEVYASAPAGTTLLQTLRISHPETTRNRDALDLCFVVDKCVDRSVPVSKVDLCFAVDTTGSMSGQIANVVAVAEDIADLLSARFASVRYAVVDFKDETETEIATGPTFVNFATCEAALAALTAEGGEDTAENGFGAIYMAADTLDWRTGADVLRIILLFSDTGSHERGSSYFDTLTRLKSEQITLCASTEGESAGLPYTGMMTETGGMLIDALDLKGLLRGIIRAQPDDGELNALRDMISDVVAGLDPYFAHKRVAIVSFSDKGLKMETGVKFIDESALPSALLSLKPVLGQESELRWGWEALHDAATVLDWNYTELNDRLMIVFSHGRNKEVTRTKEEAEAALRTRKIRLCEMTDSSDGFNWDVEISVEWTDHPDMDIRVEAFSQAVGWMVGDGNGFLRWVSQDQDGEPETVWISWAEAVAAGMLSVGADLVVNVGADWYEPASASPGTSPLLRVTTRDGRTATQALSPSFQSTGVTSAPWTVTIPADIESPILIT